MNIEFIKKIIHTLIFVSILSIPLSSLSQQAIPYQTGFEPPTFSVGSLHNQDNWWVTEGVAEVQTTKIYEGSQAVKLESNTTIVKDFNGAGHSVVWAQGYFCGAGISGSPEIPEETTATAIIFFSSDNGIQCLDGDGNGGGTFVSTGVMLSADTWHKITVKLDFNTQSWDCYIDDVLRASNLGFKDNVPQFNGFMDMSKEESYLDLFKVLPSLKGDANLDGSVDVVDVVILVNHLNNNPQQTDPIRRDNMDVDNSGDITSADLTELIDLILGKI